MPEEPKKTLLLLCTGSLQEMLAKGNVWYLRHYEVYFDRIVAAYMFGEPHEPVTNGKVTLVSISRGGSGWWQYLTLPWRVFRCAGKIRPTHFVSGDTLFYWWTFSLIRWLLGAKVVLMPVYSLEDAYRNIPGSITGLPRWMERFSTRLSFALADRVLTADSCGRFVSLLSTQPGVRGKLVVTRTIVDALPPIGFYDELARSKAAGGGRDDPADEFRLITVGRLHAQKLPADLVRMMGCLKAMLPGRPRVTLTFIGEGPEQPRLEKLADDLGVRDAIRFAGTVPNEQLPRRLLASDAFVSPMTGTALREAALCGLPLVAYDADWIQGFLVHERDALLAPLGDYRGLARHVAALARDGRMRRRFADAAAGFAERFFTPASLRASLAEAFA